MSIGKIFGILILIYFVGAFTLVGVYLIYSAIHIIGILIGILPPPWYDIDIIFRWIESPWYLAIINLIVGALALYLWEQRQKKLEEQRFILRKKRDLEWEKERKFNKYKSFYERAKKKKKKKKIKAAKKRSK